MSTVFHRYETVNGIRMHYVEAGEGPLVVLCHGFPETWYSWRHQILALSHCGYRVIAPDLRGFGETASPRDVSQYSIPHLLGDIVQLLNQLGEYRCAIVGHDWGAVLAWYGAALRPDLFRSVTALSVPYQKRAAKLPTSLMSESDTDWYYVKYFQERGRAEKEFETNVRKTLRQLYYCASGNAGPRHLGAPTPIPFGMVSKEGLLSNLPDPVQMPEWMTDHDLDVCVKQFESSGFEGGLNLYRNIDRNWETLAFLEGRRIEVPALFIVGDRDPVLQFPGMTETLDNLKTYVPKLREVIMLTECGHWTQQERPLEVSAALLSFLEGVTEYNAVGKDQ